MRIRVKNLPKITIGRSPAVEVFEGAGAPGLVPDPVTESGRFLSDSGAWTIPAGTGDVSGPASAVNNRVAVFDGVTGKLIKDGGKTIAEIEAAASAPVDSVNGQTGVVVLNASDVGAYADTNPSNFINAAGAPVQSVAGKTGTITLVKGDVGLGNVDNTSDLNKPISTATQTALNGKVDETVATTGTAIDFTAPKIFGTSASPETGNITEDLTGAVLGTVQKIYHNHSVAPTVPAGWVLLGSGTYTTSVLNIIYGEFCGSGRVEYWIVQEA